MDGFPDINKIVTQLKVSPSGQFQGHASYSVCTAFPDGSLVIPEVSLQQWRKTPFEEQAFEFQRQHDISFNEES